MIFLPVHHEIDFSLTSVKLESFLGVRGELIYRIPCICSSKICQNIPDALCKKERALLACNIFIGSNANIFILFLFQGCVEEFG